MDVYELSRVELRDLAWNLRLTRHARQRLIERFGMNPKDNGDCLLLPILSYNFAYMNTDGYINVGITDNSYLVVAPKENTYLVITYKEPSHNGYTIKDKYKFALMGITR